MQRQLFRFIVAGTIGFLADAGILQLALFLGLGYFAGRAVSFLCAVWVTWQINRRFAFSATRTESAWVEWWRYLVAMSSGGAINYGAYSVAMVTLPHTPFLPILGVAIGSLAGMSVNFLSAKLWVFRQG
jgi:putative flippase GtrA